MSISAFSKIRRMFERKAIVLMYHRIAELYSDPWQLAVSPANFEQHLSILGKTNRLISVKNMASGLSSGSFPRNCLCITFDDGYRDNFFVAKPLLEKYDCPASFFIASHYVGLDLQFWWDELEDMIFNSPKLPETLSIKINADVFEYRLQNDGVLTGEDQKKQRSWVWPDEPPTQRSELYLSIWERLKPLPYPQLSSLMDELKLWAGYVQPSEGNNLAMNAEQIESMLKNPLLDIGIHTMTHPALASHSAETQYTEISGCKQYLEERFNRTITSIAYPYGNYNNQTLQIARELSLTAAFTTEERLITKSDHPYRLGRFQVKNWNGDEFEKQLYHWVKHFL